MIKHKHTATLIETQKKVFRTEAKILFRRWESLLSIWKRCVNTYDTSKENEKKNLLCIHINLLASFGILPPPPFFLCRDKWWLEGTASSLSLAFDGSFNKNFSHATFNNIIISEIFKVMLKRKSSLSQSTVRALVEKSFSSTVST